jgi:adenylyltransferase/sulfurtransferase
MAVAGGSIAALTFALGCGRAEGAMTSGISFHDRQHRCREIGPEGQEKLRRARVAIVGLGALGSVMAERLVRSGVGNLRLIDRDFVEIQNLGTQALYTLEDAEQMLPKAVAVARHLREIHPDISVEGIVADLSPENAEELLNDVDVVLDGTDNFEARFLINDVCVKLGIPWIYSAVVESYGQTMTIVPGQTACLRCLYLDPPKPGALPTCETAGILNSIPAAIAAVAATEALKLLTGRGKPNTGLLHLDLWELRWTLIPVERRSDCPTCAEGRYEFLERSSATISTILCGRDAVQLRPSGSQRLDLRALAGRLEPAGNVRLNDYLLRFRPKSSDSEIVLFRDGRAIIKNVRDEAEARSLYARYIGL